MSIIIVGVGGADFSDMNRLDADLTPLVASNHAQAARDIVQFVHLSKLTPIQLAKETLSELPSQVVEYFLSKGIQPRPPITVSDSDIPVAAIYSSQNSLLPPALQPNTFNGGYAFTPANSVPVASVYLPSPNQTELGQTGRGILGQSLNS
jgi:hypothetical protein